MTERRILVAMADSHGGSQVGLLNPETELLREDAEGNMELWQPSPTKTQTYLWELYRSHIDKTIELAAGDDIAVLHCGDLTQGVKYPNLFVSDRLADQFLIAVDNLAPWLEYENVTAMRLAKGTGSHVFGEGSSEVLVSKILMERHPDRDIQPPYHGLLDLGGVTIDYAHHGPGAGIRDWTRGNQVRYYLKSLIATEWKAGRQPARLVLRGHYHSWVWETIRESLGGQYCQFDMCLLPSYCGMGDHGHQATRSAYLQTHGLVCFEIAYGQLVQTYPFVKTLDLRTKETL